MRNAALSGGCTWRADRISKLLASSGRIAVFKWLESPDEAFADYAQLCFCEQYGVCASLIQDKAGLSQPAVSLCLKRGKR